MNATKPRIHDPVAAEARSLGRETFRLLNDPDATREDVDTLAGRVDALRCQGRPARPVAVLLDDSRRCLEQVRRRLPAATRRARSIA